MTDMGTSIDTLRQKDDEEDTLIRNIKEDYTEQTVMPQPIINEIQHQRQEEVEEYFPPKRSLVSKIYTAAKDIIIFLIIFITFNYEPVTLVVDNLLEKINIPYLGLIVRAIIASGVFFLIKKVL